MNNGGKHLELRAPHRSSEAAQFCSELSHVLPQVLLSNLELSWWGLPSPAGFGMWGHAFVICAASGLQDRRQTGGDRIFLAICCTCLLGCGGDSCLCIFSTNGTD